MFRRSVLLMVFLMTAVISTRAQTTLQLEPLGQVVIPHNQLVEGSPVGGLSGLVYDESADKFYVISDDRSEYASARFYSFELQLSNSDSLKSGAVQWTGKSFLKDANGQPYAEDLIDPEGIALGSDSVIYVSSEGDPRVNAAPFVNAYDYTGKLIRELPIPKSYWSPEKPKNDWGVRFNLGFEGLSVSPDGSKLYAALENALVQDGPAAASGNASPARMIVYEESTGHILHEYWYSADPVDRRPENTTGFSVNGLTDVLALDNSGSLLAIEREYVEGQGNHIRLYQVSTKGATDIKNKEWLQRAKRPLRPVNKWLVGDLADYGIMIDNFEGITLGPELPGGGRMLLMVSDNNFSSSQQTIFSAFRIVI